MIEKISLLAPTVQSRCALKLRKYKGHKNIFKNSDPDFKWITSKLNSKDISYQLNFSIQLLKEVFHYLVDKEMTNWDTINGVLSRQTMN